MFRNSAELQNISRLSSLREPLRIGREGGLPMQLRASRIVQQGILSIDRIDRTGAPVCRPWLSVRGGFRCRTLSCRAVRAWKVLRSVRHHPAETREVEGQRKKKKKNEDTAKPAYSLAGSRPSGLFTLARLRSTPKLSRRASASERGSRASHEARGVVA